MRACPTVTSGTCNSCSAYLVQDNGKCKDLDGGSAILTMQECEAAASSIPGWTDDTTGEECSGLCNTLAKGCYKRVSKNNKIVLNLVPDGDGNNCGSDRQCVCSVVKDETCSNCDSYTCQSVTCAANKFNDDGNFNNGCELGCPTVADGTCDTCSDKDTCTAVTCVANKFNDDNNFNNGCELGCPTVAGGTCDTCSDKDTCMAVTCAANKLDINGDATDGCEVVEVIGCPTVANGVCSTCSDEDTCTAVICVPNKFNDDNNFNNGCELGCPTVAGGTCDTCSDKGTCTAVTCVANKFNDDGDATNGCEAGCVALSGGVCAACTTSAIADCTLEQCSAGTSYSDASYTLKTAGNYCNNRVGSGGSELSFGPAADLQTCATHVQNDSRCGSEFSYSSSEKWCDCPSAEDGTCTEAAFAGYNIYTLTFKNKFTTSVEQLPAPRTDIILHKEDFECSSLDEELEVNNADLTLQQCSDKCRAQAGCQFFIFGKAGKAGKCYYEKTTNRNCDGAGESWAVNEYNFYENAQYRSWQCATCLTGKYQGQVLAVKGVACKFCAEGKGFVAKDKTCTMCGGGTYQAQNEAASVACALCSDGTYSNDGASKCLDCPEGEENCSFFCIIIFIDYLDTTRYYLDATTSTSTQNLAR